MNNEARDIMERVIAAGADPADIDWRNAATVLAHECADLESKLCVNRAREALERMHRLLQSVDI